MVEEANLLCVYSLTLSPAGQNPAALVLYIS